MSQRIVVETIAAQSTRDGNGVRIQRLSGLHQQMDPFLMFDELCSEEQADYIGGFPPHPHRGIETLTYMLDGGFVHEDSLGHRAELKSGGAQWMSTGSGMIHSEMPLIEQNRLHGFQLWVNLPAIHKMRAPEYAQVDTEELPSLVLGTQGLARAVAGHWNLAGQTLESPLNQLAAGARVLDLRLVAAQSVVIDTSLTENLLAYVYSGDLLHNVEVSAGAMVFFSTGTELQLQAGIAGVRLLLLAGVPLKEPVVQHGPFVMNSAAQIRQAISDYKNKTFVQVFK